MFVTVLLDVLALGIVIPVLPKLVEQFAAGDTKRAAVLYGAFGTAFALMQFLFSPVLGSLSDRFGRRPVILVSCFGLGLDYIVMAVAPSIEWLFVGRGVPGSGCDAGGRWRDRSGPRAATARASVNSYAPPGCGRCRTLCAASSRSATPPPRARLQATGASLRPTSACGRALACSTDVDGARVPDDALFLRPPFAAA
ncbi:MAG: MFS transporter [Myxococcales bacterium]|nr:MFS transporter [Myxococcales bacterium]